MDESGGFFHIYVGLQLVDLTLEGSSYPFVIWGVPIF